MKNAEAKQVEGRDPYVGRNRDAPEVAAWRERMGTDEAKAIYRLRLQTAEWVNDNVATEACDSSGYEERRKPRPRRLGSPWRTTSIGSWPLAEPPRTPSSRNRPRQ